MNWSRAAAIALWLGAVVLAGVLGAPGWRGFFSLVLAFGAGVAASLFAWRDLRPGGRVDQEVERWRAF